MTEFFVVVSFVCLFALNWRIEKIREDIRDLRVKIARLEKQGVNDGH